MFNNKKEKIKHEPILAIDPVVRGFGYVVFEGPYNPIDWGLADIRFCKNKRILKRISKLVDLYQPKTIIIEQSKGSLRCGRVQRLLNMIEQWAKKNDVEVARYSRDQILEVFGQFGKKSKHEIASMIAEWLPELAPRLPTKRKCYEPESEQYGIFDAVALAVTHMYLTE